MLVAVALLLQVSAASPASPASHAGYRIGPGDVLDLTVAQETALTGRYAVDDSGAIDLEPLLGNVTVAGKTVEQADALLTEKLKRYLKAPTVRLSVAEYDSQKVYVLGAVAREGVYPLEGPTTVLDAILDAGGTTAGAVGKLTVFHQDERSGESDPEIIELSKLLAEGPSGPANVKLANGDMVLVPGTSGPSGAAGDSVVDETAAHVTVVGEVNHAGVFLLEPGGTALSAVLAAGGLTKYASPNRAKVVRTKDGSHDVISLELGDIMKHGDKKKDVALEPGDMVIVPARLF